MYLLDSLCARTAILIFLLAYELRHSTDNVTHRASQDSFSFGCLIFLQYRYMPELRVLLRIMLIAEEHFVTIVFTQLPLVPRDANLPAAHAESDSIISDNHIVITIALAAIWQQLFSFLLP